MRTTLLAALLATLCAVPGAAQEAPDPILRTSVNSIWFDNWIGLSDAMLRVAAPDGTMETIYEKSRAPSFKLSGSRIVDGRYRFELRAATDERVPNRSDLPALDGEEPPETVPVPFYMTGAFMVKGGAVQPPAEGGEED